MTHRRTDLSTIGKEGGRSFHALETPPRLPEGWRWVKLGEVCEIISGTTPKSGESRYWDGEIVWITPTDLGKLNERYIRSSDRRITKAGFQSCNLALITVGAVVLSSRAPIGHLGIAAVPFCTNQGCKTFVPSGEVDSEFLYHALKGSIWDLQQMGSGATFAEVSKSQLEGFEIPLPPLPEQKRIAAILNEQMAAVERARKAAEERLAAVKELPAAYLRAVFPAPDQPLPAGWRWVKLGEVLRLRKEVVHPRDNPHGPTIFVGLEHVESNTGRRTGSENVEMSELTGRKPRFYASDIVYGYLRPYLNKVWLAEFDGLCSVDQYVFSVEQASGCAAYVAWFMRSPVYLENSPVGKTPGWLPRIRTEEVSSVVLPLPPLPEQKRIAAILNEQMAVVELARKAAEEELATINALPAALLRRAFAGEL